MVCYCVVYVLRVSGSVVWTFFDVGGLGLFIFFIGCLVLRREFF